MGGTYVPPTILIGVERYRTTMKGSELKTKVRHAT